MTWKAARVQPVARRIIRAEMLQGAVSMALPRRHRCRRPQGRAVAIRLQEGLKPP